MDREPFATPTSAADTMTGVTSGDVHDGIGKPGSGMTSAEMRHDGQHGRRKQGLGGGEQWGKGRAEDVRMEGEESMDIQL